MACRTFGIRWDWGKFNDNRLKVIELQNTLHKKGRCVSSFNGEATYIHKGYTWQVQDQTDCNMWNDGKEGNWTYFHIKKVKDK